MAKHTKKSDLPTKVCATCGRPFAWRRKWAKAAAALTAGGPVRPLPAPLPEMNRVFPLQNLRLGLLALPLLLAACGDPAPDQSHLPPDRRVETRISPALDVELSAMEARPSGLYIQDLVVGEGIRADSGDVAKVHYAGWLPSGMQFDARREGPGLEVALGYGRVIAGWDQGVVGMRVGGRRLLVVPPGLAYGAEGRGRIPRNATLVFEVELLEVEDRTPGGGGAP